MKRFFVLILLVASGSLLMGQTGQSKPKSAAAKPAAPASKPMKTLLDSFSYALGVNIGSSLRSQGMTTVNSALFAKAFNDALTGRPCLVDDNSAISILTSYSEKVQVEKSKGVIEAGKAYLDKNKLRPEIKTTATGLQYEVLREGTGAKLAASDTFVAHYRGSLIDGTEFDASYPRNEPLTMPANQVIPGWTEGLQLMPVGSKYKFFIPYDLGYGLRGNPPVIPGGATLIFEVELLDVKKVGHP
jgi:FKBP-type peptidyl-prolyl cis-trans isomerase FklB